MSYISILCDYFLVFPFIRNPGTGLASYKSELKYMEVTQ